MLQAPRKLLRNISFWATLNRSSKKHIFVSGVPRSGTTLLKAVIENHPEVCGPDYETTTVFSDLDDIFTREDWPLDDRIVNRGLSDTDDIVAFYDFVVGSTCEKENASLFVDKMPWPPNRFRLLYGVSKFPNARWIHIVRDGRDCYCSALNHPNVPQSEDVSSFAKYWAKTIETHEKHMPDERRLTVRYEDFVKDTSGEVASIMDFVGLDFQPEQIEPSKRKEYSPGAEGAHSRLGRPITDASVGRWKEEMEPDEVSAFHQSAGRSLRRWGYEGAE